MRRIYAFCPCIQTPQTAWYLPKNAWTNCLNPFSNLPEFMGELRFDVVVDLVGGKESWEQAKRCKVVKSAREGGRFATTTFDNPNPRIHNYFHVIGFMLPLMGHMLWAGVFGCSMEHCLGGQFAPDGPRLMRGFDFDWKLLFSRKEGFARSHVEFCPLVAK